MKMLNRLKKSISTILLFIRAFEIACIVLNRKKTTPQQKKKSADSTSIMGVSKTKVGEAGLFKLKAKEVPEIDYEAEAIPLETREISFESLEQIDSVITGKEELTEKSKKAIKNLGGTELGHQIKNRISSLLDNVELKSRDIKDNTELSDLSALLD
ncbi:hypothetical protein [Massilibacteroides vaginae]|uniref:hypothetical protein n=1 Tax=Massilibacteroides vaginae TaxID=1673718 RepID=UPI0015937BFB|nr:hypothetical protein [Massilibacteroides vaginae]